MVTFLTKYDGKFIGPVAKVLGYLMEGIYWVLDKLHIGNVGLAIILFTIAIYLLLLPLTIKQQKFSKLSAKITPEINAIRAKYKGKTDQESMMAMQAETKAVYAKYGVSQSGTCLQLLIQMPILFALYRVIYAVPAYVGSLKNTFRPAVDAIVGQGQAGLDVLRQFSSVDSYFKDVKSDSFQALFTAEDALSNLKVTDRVVDLLNRATTEEWTSLKSSLPEISDQISNTQSVVDKINHFGNLNIANTPVSTMTDAFSKGAFFVVFCALLIPVLAAVTQFINVKLMPNAADNGNGKDDNPMASSMKTMNTIMPLMSAFISLNLPIGMGIYWIAGAVVRTIQQIIINKHMDKIDIDEMIAKNLDKYNEQMAKVGKAPVKSISSNANMSTKSVNATLAKERQPKKSQEEREADMKKASEFYGKHAEKPGSLAAKANMVKHYDERKNNKDK